MWPLLLDMTKEESLQCLRKLELEAYAHLVDALRAQGHLNNDKKRLLKETSAALNISQDRHKAEVRRAINDEKLNTIAYHVTGVIDSVDDWALEGRRTVPLLPRTPPQTAYSIIADEAAINASQINRQLPPPICTERKRPPPVLPIPISMPEVSKPLSFRIPEPPRIEENSKKRKLPMGAENSTLAQHLLGPSKMSRTQQYYRQRTKALLKDQGTKLKQDMLKNLPPLPKMPPSNGPKLNILQNISIPTPTDSAETIEQIQNEINNYAPQKQPEQNHIVTNPIPGCSNENQSPLRPKLLTNIKPTITIKPPLNSPGPSHCESPTPPKTIKLSSTTTTNKKPIITPKPAPINQKLIVVSNAQTIPTSSILQKTLQIPLVKNLSIKNLEKFKIVSTTTVPANIQLPLSTTSVTTSAGSTNINSLKHKVVTVKTANPTPKKVIPLSQLLNTKGGIKVLPIGGKIVGKTTTTTSSPLIITMGNVQQRAPITTTTLSSSSSSLSSLSLSSTPFSSTTIQINEIESTNNNSKTNGKSGVLGDILKASGVISDDFDAQIEEFRIPNNHFATEKIGGENSKKGEVIDLKSTTGEYCDNKKRGSNEIIENVKDVKNVQRDGINEEKVSEMEKDEQYNTATEDSVLIQNSEDLVSETN